MSEASRAWSWRHAFSSSGLPATTKHVLHTLGMFMNELGEGCYPSVADICRYSGLDKKTVMKHLAGAREAGWIAVAQHGYRGQKWKRNEYAARWPERDLVAPCLPLDEEGGGGDTPPFDGENAVDLPPEGGGTEGLKVVEQLHQDKTSPETTPTTSPVEREREREGGEETETAKAADDRRAVERAFEKAWQAWPTSVSDSRPSALKAWQALSAEERVAAEAEAGRYVEASRAVGRKHIIAHAVYLAEKRWTQLPPATEAARAESIEAPPFGKLWMAARLKKLLRGPSGQIPELTRAQQHWIEAGVASPEDLKREKAAKFGYPGVNAMHERAANGGKGVSVAAALEPLAALMAQVRVGSEEWKAWEVEHSSRGWPWLPDPGRQEWVYLPAGGPVDGLKLFEDAVRGNDVDGGARQAAE